MKEINDEELMRVASEHGLGRPDDLLAAIGYGKFSARTILARLVPAQQTTNSPNEPSEPKHPGVLTSVVRRVFGGDVSPLQVTGHDDLMVYRARCCNPIRGEEIIGYVTRGKGVAVHSKSCPNVETLMYEPERRIAVEWGSEGKINASTPWADRLSGQAGCALRQPARHAETDHRCHQRREYQHPQHRRQLQKKPTPPSTSSLTSLTWFIYSASSPACERSPACVKCSACRSCREGRFSLPAFRFSLTAFS